MRSAGEDAWLGKPAPEDPTLDGPQATAEPLQLEYNKHFTKNDNTCVPSKQLATTGVFVRKMDRSNAFAPYINSWMLLGM